MMQLAQAMVAIVGIGALISSVLVVHALREHAQAQKVRKARAERAVIEQPFDLAFHYLGSTHYAWLKTPRSPVDVERSLEDYIRVFKETSSMRVAALRLVARHYEGTLQTSSEFLSHLAAQPAVETVRVNTIRYTEDEFATSKTAASIVRHQRQS